MSQTNPLKRSNKTDIFPGSSAILRERSFVKSTSKDVQKRKSQTITMVKGKPTMEIYRPPNVRTDLVCHAGKLNVHAKEFIMNHELQPSRSSVNIPANYEAIAALQHSKSSGSILRTMNHHSFLPIMNGVPLPLLHSTPQIITPIINYPLHNEIIQQQLLAGQLQHQQQLAHQQHKSQHLKRSKSLGSNDSRNLAAQLKALKEEIDLSIFSEDKQAHLKQVLEDPTTLSSRATMDLVKTIMEQVVQGLRYSESCAKICVSMIDKEMNETFLESLLNMCQQWYQERDKILRGIKTEEGTRFTAFMWFLTELCGQLKRHQVKEQYGSLQPELVLLSILGRCCQACVSLPIKCLSETECLFFVLTSIGKDLESELPEQLDQLMGSVRDGFLGSAGSNAVRRTLLQLIELHASNWQLPGSSVLYYYPRIK